LSKPDDLVEATPFSTALDAMPPQRFALIDGAHFEALPTQLVARGLKGQPLYLEGPDRDAVEAGPFLVDAATPAALAAVLSLVRSKPAVVFWSWLDGQPSLYRHLRGLTMVEVPLEGDAEPVLFRLADPRALSLVLPVLSMTQLARFAGAATQIVFAREDGAPVTLAAPAAEAVRGFLRLTRDQYDAVARGFETATVARAVATFAPHLPLPADQAGARVHHALARARHYGFEDLKDVWQFIAWDVAFGADFEQHPRFAEGYAELVDPDNAPALRMFYLAQAVDALRAVPRAA
jgi:hypothetical protein